MGQRFISFQLDRKEKKIPEKYTMKDLVKVDQGAYQRVTDYIKRSVDLGATL